jgi:hypothetical protein
MMSNVNLLSIVLSTLFSLISAGFLLKLKLGYDKDKELREKESKTLDKVSVQLDKLTTDVTEIRIEIVEKVGDNKNQVNKLDEKVGYISGRLDRLEAIIDRRKDIN